MDYILTRHIQYSKKGNDSKNRNYVLYFLNNELIFKQKLPFDENLEKGFDRRTIIYNEFIKDGKIYQKRRRWLGCGHVDNDKTEIRNVSFPLSKQRLKKYNIPPNYTINITKRIKP
jgi:hypothetical protein